MSNSVIGYIGHLGGITYKEGVATVTADHPHPLRLDGQCRLGRLLLWDYHHRAQVDYASAVGGTKRRILEVF